MLQKLPIGIQSFSDLRSNNYLYVDKTEDIYRMITTGKPYFLSRPRRFGKSLLLSTLEAVFQGRKELFEGLYIYDRWDWTKRYPVIRIDCSVTSNRSPEMLVSSLNIYLDTFFDEYNLEQIDAPLEIKFRLLIAKLCQATGEKVVVLIDEYDKPVIDNLNDLDVANKNRIVLHDFYQVLKASDDHLKFIFLTGVSKFSRVSVFSGLNNLNDITLDTQYATICGYSQEELESNFDSYIEKLAEQDNLSKQEIIDKIKGWYDGYSWDGETNVYNPFSSLQLFTKNRFIDYWFESGTPTFLINLIKERNDVKTVTQSFEIPVDAFSAFELNRIDTRLLLFQTGYLTVKKVVKSCFSDTLNYVLGIPNEEVRRGLITHLLSSFSNSPISETSSLKDRMMGQLFEGNSSAFERSLQELFARIPYQLHLPFEAYYHSLFLVWLNLLGFKIDAEISTGKGRIDAVWTWNERVVITEIKYSSKDKIEPLLTEAMQQIRERRYYERYAGENKRIAMLAIAFAGKDIACRMEELKASD